MPHSSRDTTPKTIHFPDHWRIFGPEAEVQPSSAAAPQPERKALLDPVSVLVEKTPILIAEDDTVSRELLALRLDQWGFQVIVTRDGASALEELRKPEAPPLAILDWMMPGYTGVEICQKMREANKAIYLILLTARDRKEDIVEGLRAGADDYLIKPFHKDELHARIQVGVRIIALQRLLMGKIEKLNAAREELRKLRGDSSAQGAALV
jgi:DNA-binding response OmpR family regulator